MICDLPLKQYIRCQCNFYTCGSLIFHLLKWAIYGICAKMYEDESLRIMCRKYITYGSKMYLKRKFAF